MLHCWPKPNPKASAQPSRPNHWVARTTSCQHFVVPLRMHADEIEVTEALVAALIADQMPDLAALPMTIVEPWGTDNAIWRLGDDLVVRLPFARAVLAIRRRRGGAHP